MSCDPAKKYAKLFPYTVEYDAGRKVPFYLVAGPAEVGDPSCEGFAEPEPADDGTKQEYATDHCGRSYYCITLGDTVPSGAQLSKIWFTKFYSDEMSPPHPTGTEWKDYDKGDDDKYVYNDDDVTVYIQKFAGNEQYILFYDHNIYTGDGKTYLVVFWEIEMTWNGRPYLTGDPQVFNEKGGG